MRHHQQQRTLGRTRRQRTALMRGLAVSLIENGALRTTEARAKELRPFMERLITLGKKGTIATRRIAAARLGEPNVKVIKKLFEEIAPHYHDRSGGYTRVVKMGPTYSGKREAVIELV